jgi:hypothetical protein
MVIIADTLRARESTTELKDDCDASESWRPHLRAT